MFFFILGSLFFINTSAQTNSEISSEEGSEYALQRTLPTARKKEALNLINTKESPPEEKKKYSKSFIRKKIIFGIVKTGIGVIFILPFIISLDSLYKNRGEGLRQYCIYIGSLILSGVTSISLLYYGIKEQRNGYQMLKQQEIKFKNLL